MQAYNIMCHLIMHLVLIKECISLQISIHKVTTHTHQSVQERGQ